jgi:hypothetical protein
MENACKAFVLLYEGIIDEASTTMDQIRNRPGGPQIVNQLHKVHGLAHDQQYEELPKILWNNLKDAIHGSWALVYCDRGVGAIMKVPGSGDYKAYASSGDTPKQFNDDRGGNILDFMKREIGMPRKFFVGIDTGVAQGIRRKRANLKHASTALGTTFTYETIERKFKPLFLSAAKAAYADVKGMAGSMLKNDAHHRINPKIQTIKRLSAIINAIESDTPMRHDDPRHALKQIIKNAVVMTASHYYPDETGEITATYVYSIDQKALMPARQTGVQHVMQDLNSGDGRKLSAILAFFKQGMMHV